MSKFIYNEKLKEVIDDLKKITKRRCYEILIENLEPDILDDKMGGKPYLPVGEDYPKDSNGNPMELLLQVNLKNLDLKDFPKNGILEIFVSVPLECSPSENVVKIFEEGLEYQTKFPRFKHITKEQKMNESAFKLTFEPSVDYIPMGHYKLGELLAKSLNKHFGTNLSGDINELDDFFDNGEYFEVNSKGKKEDFIWTIAIPDMISEGEETLPATFGGYAEFVQGDIRDFEYVDKDVCICKISYVLSKDKSMQTDSNIVGEGGVLNVLISKKDLKNKNFKDTIVAWDCD